MHTQKSGTLSPEEYLMHETQAVNRSEYYHGTLVSIDPASINHNRIVGNGYSLLHTALDGKHYEPFWGIRLWIEREQVYTYPDVMVVAGEPKLGSGMDDTITNPVTIIEVLSDATRNCDRGEKFMVYRAIPGFRDYLLIEQSSVHIEHFTRIAGNQWVLSEYDDLLCVVVLSSVPVEIPLRDVYRRVTF